jgi:purine nucleosidase
MNPNGGRSKWLPAPQFNSSMQYVHLGLYRPIRVYDLIDVRFILEDFFAKLARFARGDQPTAVF